MSKVYTDRNGNSFTYRNNQKVMLNQGNFQNNQNNQKQIVKKSGFETKMMDNDDLKTKVPVCFGWRKSGNGIQSLYARPYSKSKISMSEAGDKYINLFVELKNPNTGVIKTSGMYNFTTKKLTIKDLGLVGSPVGSGVTSSGKRVKGYFGKF